MYYCTFYSTWCIGNNAMVYMQATMQTQMNWKTATTADSTLHSTMVYLHFWQKCPSSSAKKWHFERPEPRTDPKNPAKHPPKWWGRHLAHSFPFSGEYEANFWKFHILGLSGALFPLPRTPNFRWSVQWHLWVYRFETCFLGSPNHPKTALPWPKKNSKIFFVGPG